MPIDLSLVERIALVAASGAAVVYPPAAPLVAILKEFLKEAEKHGILPHELTAEQAAAIAAGMAAARASAVTSDMVRRGAAMDLAPYKERVLVERRELADKLAKLQGFCDSESPTFAAMSLVDQGLLAEQAEHMAAYLDVLDRRIQRFSA